MIGERQTATAALSEQRGRARKAVEAGRYAEALAALHDGALNAFLLQDVPALEEIGAVAGEVIEEAGDAYLKARGAEVRRSAQSFRSRSWQSGAKSRTRADEVTGTLATAS
jgi:hypothetical protein